MEHASVDASAGTSVGSETTKPNTEYSSDDGVDSGINEISTADVVPNEINYTETLPQYANTERDGEGSYAHMYENMNENQSNSSHVLQSSFQADGPSKSVYNGMSNIEQNEMVAMKSVGSSKARSITDDFNLKYLHSLKK
tara:strand:+ start:1585 stop:2004 length:420 start_codon:yes stop_codon:yes gene_type:complete